MAYILWLKANKIVTYIDKTQKGIHKMLLDIMSKFFFILCCQKLY
jgi:hypothetical protein